MKDNYTPVKLPNYLISQMDNVINKEPKMFSSRPDFIKFLVNSYLHNNGGGKMGFPGGGGEGGSNVGKPRGCPQEKSTAIISRNYQKNPPWICPPSPKTNWMKYSRMTPSLKLPVKQAL